MVSSRAGRSCADLHVLSGTVLAVRTVGRESGRPVAGLWIVFPTEAPGRRRDGTFGATGLERRFTRGRRENAGRARPPLRRRPLWRRWIRQGRGCRRTCVDIEAGGDETFQQGGVDSRPFRILRRRAFRDQGAIAPECDRRLDLIRPPPRLAQRIGDIRRYQGFRLASFAEAQLVPQERSGRQA